MFLNCSTSFERHTAHYQEFKNCDCSLWFYIRLWLLAAVMAEWSPHDSCRQPQTCVISEAAITVFELMIMSGISFETCWAITKHWNNKFYYTVASCWIFLYDLCYDARIHEHQANHETSFIKLIAYSFLRKISALLMSHDKKNEMGGTCVIREQV
jgi:hypothetical protein